MFKKYWIFLLIPSYYFTPQSVLANQHIPFQLSTHQLSTLFSSSFVASLSLGPTFASGGSAQTRQLAPEITKTFTANNPSNTLANIELMLGIQQPLGHQLLGQIGIDAATTSGAKLSGNIWDDASPLFNNYAYRYQLNHTQLSLKGKLIGDYGWSFMPWLSVMAGVGFNHASNFGSTPLIFEAVPTPDFSEHTTTAFTYGFGIGAQHELAKHWQVGIGYEWVDWGKSQLGSVNGGSNNQTISLSHFYASSVMFNVSFLASNK